MGDFTRQSSLNCLSTKVKEVLLGEKEARIGEVRLERGGVESLLPRTAYLHSSKIRGERKTENRKCSCKIGVLAHGNGVPLCTCPGRVPSKYTHTNWKLESLNLFSPIQHRPKRVLLAFISRFLFCSLSTSS